MLTLLLFALAAPPVVRDPALQLELVAEAPDLATPVAVAADAAGRVFAIESHTHFRPKNYAGPKADRLRVFSDFGPDGRARKTSTWHEGEVHSMGLGLAPDGALWVATRKEIFALRDTDGDGKADQRTPLLKLETAADYPHNGLSGFAFDQAGNAWFGLGENFGAPYTLTGTDGSRLTGGGEGGSVFNCDRHGGKLRRWSAGFWNPFHLCFDGAGRLFVVDNDPDDRPPCRLLHAVPGGDFGYRFRNGRRGTHPFTAWNGELPFTLPMVAGTGEAPSGLVWLDHPAWPAEWRGVLVGTSWGDHRLERFRLRPRGVSVHSVPEPFVTGGDDFRPVGAAMAPDGALYVSDWVDKSYELHGRGRLWRVKPRAAYAGPARPLAYPPAAATLAQPPNDTAGLASTDPFVARERLNELLTQRDRQRWEGKLSADPQPMARIAVAVSLRDRSHPDENALLRGLLRDADAAVRFAAVQTIHERKLTALRPDLDAALAAADLPGRMLEACLATLDGFDRTMKNAGDEKSGATLIAEFMARGSRTAAQWRRALPLLPPEHPALTPARLDELLAHPDRTVVAETLRTLWFRADGKARLEAFAARTADAELRAEALAALAPRPAEETDQPAANDLQAWLARLAGPADANAGRRVFFHPQGPGCWKCHAVAGRGAAVGPELTNFGATAPRARLVDSILRPHQEIAPLYVPWLLELADGRQLTGLYVGGTNKNEQTYVDANGMRHALHPEEIARRQPAGTSIMPEGLQRKMTAREFRDLLAFLGAAP